MAENAIYKVESNENIAKDVLKMRLLGPTESLVNPGQFINIQLPGLYLRRPISVADWGEGWLDIVYKVVGRGTAKLSRFAKGTELDVLCGLGNGFCTGKAEGKTVALIGGGVGTPPLYGLAKALIKQGNVPTVVLGFAGKDDVFFEKELTELGCKVMVSTEDGSCGHKGFCTEVLAGCDFDYYYTCGPEPMLKAVHKICTEKGINGQLSFEERMGCGFGACMGCSCQTQLGTKRVCVDGPVFSSEEVTFA